jgi:hypothetical protein
MPGTAHGGIFFARGGKKDWSEKPDPALSGTPEGAG